MPDTDIINSNTRRNQAKILRIFRKIHRTTGALLFVFFFIIAITGILLGWKKNSSGYLLAKSYEGKSTELKDWLTLDSLHSIASKVFRDSFPHAGLPEVDRIDVRKDKGMVKVLFKNHYLAVQLDGMTGALLHVETRRADFIENIHDASYLDRTFGGNGGFIKLIYTSIMGLALLVFTVTGFWLWYGPKRMRRQNNSRI